MKGYRLDADMELLPGGAAMLPNPRTVVVADLHLGCEAALEHEGLSLPRVQTRKIGEYLDEVIAGVSPDLLVVAGDLKHNFSRNLVQEWSDVTDFVRRLADLVRVVVVRGNHDNYLSLILQEMGLPLRREYRVGPFTVLHGHAPSDDAPGMRIMGHIHPSVVLRDSAGARVKTPCYLYEGVGKTLVLPALSIVSPGVDVVGNPESDRMSPLLAEGGLGNFVPIVFDGDGPLTFPMLRQMRRQAR